MLYLYNGVLHSHIKEQRKDVCYNVDATTTLYATTLKTLCYMKEPDTKGPVLYDSIYVKYLE